MQQVLAMFCSALKVLALAAVSLAIPAPNSKGIENLPADFEVVNEAGDVVLCTGSYPDHGCKSFALPALECFDFDGKLASYYKTLVGVRVPHGRFCVAHKDPDCQTKYNIGFLDEGVYNLDVDLLPNAKDMPVSFARKVVSIVCFGEV